MITEFRVHNFKTFVNASFAFERRHLLIGDNTSGKSNLCQALAFLQRTVSRSLYDAVQATPGGMQDFCNYPLRATDQHVALSLTAQFWIGDIEYRFKYDLDFELIDVRENALLVKPQLPLQKEQLTVSGGQLKDTTLLKSEGKIFRFLDEERLRAGESGFMIERPSRPGTTALSGLYDSPQTRLTALFRTFLTRVRHFSFSADRIRHGWREDDTAEQLSTDGGNLAQQVFRLKSADELRYRRMLERVQRIEPRLSAVNFLSSTDQRIIPVVELEDRYKSTWESLSEGTLRALAISYVFEGVRLAAVRDDEPPYTCMIEEPENSLTVSELIRLLYDVDNIASAAQIIFTSHSPYFINQFDDKLSAITLLKRMKWHTSSETLEHRRAEIEAELENTSLGDQYIRGLLG